jgi:putative membrane protein
MRNAVLIFCSVAERYVEILVDDAVALKLPEGTWSPIVSDFQTAMAGDRVAEAFVAAAGACARALAPVFPASPDQVDYVPDRLEEI